MAMLVADFVLCCGCVVWLTHTAWRVTSMRRWSAWIAASQPVGFVDRVASCAFVRFEEAQ
jgi:hypothetical protein